MQSPVSFYFDFSSPYSYIASEWIEALAARHGRTVRWQAILLGATFQATGLRPPVDFPLKREYALRDFARSARLEGIPYQQPVPFPIATQNAARIFWWLHAQDADRATAWAHAALRAYFTGGVRLDDAAALRKLAERAGIDANDAEAAWADPQWKLRLKQANEEALAAGVFGAPWFVVDGEPFWGNDRKPQVERWLAGDRF
ncbi:2-hydroxychromene-2-carboxylate isomerase [Aquincola sp. MAHUQ-54]|uniref:2-hydroxychromene-2-carboxylate isomerase n=1 Tax=Aquincola agrisoli TaxID=3119538 RepID=A0AAW9QFZ8_9BURK